MKYLKMLQQYLGNSERYFETGHSALGFIMGMMSPITMLLWVGFVLIDELICDGHYKFFKEDLDKKLDFIFDLQSKLVSTLLGYIYMSYFGFSVTCDFMTIILIFLIGYKAPYYFAKFWRK